MKIKMKRKHLTTQLYMSDCVTHSLYKISISPTYKKITKKEMNSSKNSLLYFEFFPFKMNNVMTAIKQIKSSFDKNQKR